MVQPPRVQSFDLKYGPLTTLRFNAPITFRLRLIRGTSIDGVIPANTDFTVCSWGDIVEFSIVIDDNSIAPLSHVPPADETPTPAVAAPDPKKEQ